MSIERLAKEKFFWTTDMMQFLLAENLALKSLLHEKGVLTPEEFAKHKELAEGILKAKVDAHIEEWKAANPEVVRRFEQAEEEARLLRAALTRNPDSRSC
jgi:hypothetical protein